MFNSPFCCFDIDKDIRDNILINIPERYSGISNNQAFRAMGCPHCTQHIASLETSFLQQGHFISLVPLQAQANKNQIVQKMMIIAIIGISPD